MNEMEKLIAKLPRGVGYEWTGLSYQERLSGLAGAGPLRPLDPGGVPVPGGALRELVDPARR